MYTLENIKRNYPDFEFDYLTEYKINSYTDVIYNTKEIIPGCAFICLRGFNHNTHNDITEIVEKGAKLIVVEEDVLLPDDSVSIIKVKSTRIALAYFSADKFDYAFKKLKVIGVTGTKGKTTTTHLIKHALEQLGHKVGMIGTNGCYIGEEHIALKNTTPESFVLHQLFSKMVSKNCTHVVLEVSSQSVKLSRIAGITFDIGVFLNISEDHIGVNEHADFTEYLYYKTKFFEQCKQIIINRDDEQSQKIIDTYPNKKIHQLSLNNIENIDFRVNNITYVKDNEFVGTEFLVNNHLFRLGLPGYFNIYNAVAAIAVLYLLNEEIDKLMNLLSTVVIDGRMENVFSNSKFSIIVDYAHNTVSMENLLLTLKAYQPKRLVVLFGAGGNRAKDRRFGMGEVAGKYSDFIIITEDNSRFEQVDDIILDIRSAVVKYTSNYITIPNRKDAIEYAINHVQEGDLIVIAGRGHEQYLETNGEKRYFKDKEVVLELLKKYQWIK